MFSFFLLRSFLPRASSFPPLPYTFPALSPLFLTLYIFSFFFPHTHRTLYSHVLYISQKKIYSSGPGLTKNRWSLGDFSSCCASSAAVGFSFFFLLAAAAPTQHKIYYLKSPPPKKKTTFSFFSQWAILLFIQPMYTVASSLFFAGEGVI
jgi:hypothetical protein